MLGLGSDTVQVAEKKLSFDFESTDDLKGKAFMDRQSGLEYMPDDTPIFRGEHICTFDGGKLCEKFK